MRMATVLTMCAVGVMALGGIALAAVDKAVVDECTTGWPNGPPPTPWKSLNRWSGCRPSCAR